MVKSIDTEINYGKINKTRIGKVKLKLVTHILYYNNDLLVWVKYVILLLLYRSKLGTSIQ